MIISKDLFIFGEQIFATIIPEIGTPNTPTPITPPTTPPTTIATSTTQTAATTITPVVIVSNEHDDHLQQQHQQHQQQQQQQTNSPLKFNAIAEVALKVAAKTTTTKTDIEAAEQVSVKPIPIPIQIPKTGTIKTIPITKSTKTTTPKTQHQEETVASATQCPKTSDAAVAVKKIILQKIPKESIKLDKGKYEKRLQQKPEQPQKEQQQQQLIFHQQQQKQPQTILGGSEQLKPLKKTTLLELAEASIQQKQQKQQHLQQQKHLPKLIINCDEEPDIIQVEIEKEPLVKRNSIKIINVSSIVPAITKQQQQQYQEQQQQQQLQQQPRAEESLKLLLGSSEEDEEEEDEVEEIESATQQLVNIIRPLHKGSDCRLQLEEPETLEVVSEEQLYAASVETTSTDKACFPTSTSTSLTLSSPTSSPSSSPTVPTTAAAMGKVSLDNNGSGSNNATARSDHAMVTFPFISEQHRTLQLTFQNLSVLHNDRKILSDVSGLVSPGEVLAIMGPSGCGKTTLLDCLSGQRRIDGGSIYLNREPLSKKWRRKICYVLQEEVFFSGLTLRETVMYTALLRLPEKMPKVEKVKLVDRILQTLELNCCQQTKFGDYLNRGLSGGEKKRANIACELLTNPLLMLLDEPTSGLDSHSAISLMKVLKRYAMQEQKTVVITVHQPSSQMFHMFDKLLLLYNGRTAYFGEVNNIYSYFEDIGVAIKPHYNPADFVLEQLKSYPDIREKLFIAAKESHGNFINRNSITTFNAKHHHQPHNHQQLPQHLQNHHNHNHIHTQHHNSLPQNGHITSGHHLTMITTTNGNSNTNSDKSQQRDALINDIINNYYKDISSNNHHNLHHHHNHHHHINHDAPMLIMGSGAENHHDGCEDAAQQLWCATADSQSNFSSTSSDCHQYETDGDWLDYPTRFHTQFRVLLSRNFKEAKPLMLSKLNWFQTIGLALMAGAIWFQLPRTEEFLHDLQGWMFFSQTYWMLFALFGALNSFPAEREVISKERRSGAYRLSAYYLAKMFGELPLIVTLPTVYLIISYPMLGCASLKLFFLMLVFLLLNTIVAQSVGFFIGACCMDMNVSITLSALYTLATQLFGGYLSSRIPDGLSWIRYTSMIHYAYQNMQILEFREGPAVSCGNPSSFEVCKNNATTTFIPYQEILKAQNSTSPLWLNTLVLMMFFLVFRVLGYAVLRYIRCPKA